jgi:t-SNARE complex subunit (syntaxin)
MRQASADVLGEQHLPGEPDDTDQHVNMAFSTAEGPAVFAVATLGATEVSPTTSKLDSVSLVRLSRDHSSNEWETIAQVPFGG